MKESTPQRYFVGQLGPRSYRPCAEAVYEIQILNLHGQAERCAYLGKDSEEVIALVEDGHSGPKSLDVQNHGIPEPVLRVARRQELSDGHYVNALGEVISAF